MLAKLKFSDTKHTEMIYLRFQESIYKSIKLGLMPLFQTPCLIIETCQNRSIYRLASNRDDSSYYLAIHPQECSTVVERTGFISKFSSIILRKPTLTDK